MRGLFVGVLLGLVLVGCFFGLSFGLKIGDSGIGTNSGVAAPYILYNNVSVVVPDGYIGLISKGWVYTNSTSHIGLYSEDYALLLDSGAITATSGLGWYSVDCGLLIESGSYHIAVGYVSGGAYYFDSAVSGIYSNYSAAYDFSDPAVVQADWSGARFSGYFEFELIETSNVSEDYIGFGFVLFFVLVEVVLILVGRVPLLGIVVGLVGFGVGAWSLTVDALPYFPYLSMFVVVLSVVCVVSAVSRFRG